MYLSFLFYFFNTVISELTIVIPTMERKRNGYTYIIDTLENNKEILSNYNVYLYKDDKNITAFDNYHTIKRVSHDDILSIFEKDSYSYWRSHLCLDFMYSMKKATEMDTTSRFF